MTYKQVLDDFFTIINDHRMIKTAGYGPLSEIKVPRGTYETNYPYAFLQPTNHTLGEHQMVYRFNLIMMEMCNDDIDSVIKAQSECLQYVKDILGRLYYTYQAYDINLNFSIVPFKEKYDDVVSGVTATVEIITRDALNDCDSPFVEFQPLVWALTGGDQVVDPDPSQNKTSFGFGVINITDGNWKNSNRYEVQEAGTYKITTNLQITLQQPLPGEAMPMAPRLLTRTESPVIVKYTDPTVVTGWPTTFVNTSTVYNVYVEWDLAVASVDVLHWEVVVLEDDPTQPESGIINKAGSEIKIYRLE